VNVNRSLRYCSYLALALLAISIVPTSASAQAYRGKFTLPFSARWRGMTLPAGEYSFSVDTLTPTGMIAIQHNGKQVGSVMLSTVAYSAGTGQSELIAVPVGNIYRITVLRLENECVMEFPVPKHERQLSARTKGPELTRLVAVAANKA